MIRLTVYGTPISKKNHRNIFINRSTGKRFVGKSQVLKTYEDDCYAQLLQQKQILKIAGIIFPIEYRCCVVYHIFLTSKRKCDCANMKESVQDQLVKAQILSDDNYTIINPDISMVTIDKKISPCIEITITEYSDWIGYFYGYTKPLPA